MIKFTVVISILTIIMSFVSCGEKSDDEYIYTSEKLDIPLEEGYQLHEKQSNIAFALKNGGIGVITEGYESVDPETASEIYGYDVSTLQKDEFIFGFTNFLSYSGASQQSTTKLYSAIGVLEAVGTPDGGFVYLIDSGSGENPYELKRCDGDGNRVPLDTHGYSFYLSPDITVSDDGTIFTLSKNNRIVVFPEDGDSWSTDFPKDMKMSSGKDYKLWLGSDGDILFTYKALDPDGNMSYFSRRVDTENRCLSDAVRLPAFNGSPVWSAMPGHDMLYRTTVGLFAVDLVDGKTVPTQLLTWSDIGFVSSSICDIIPISEETIYISVRDDTDPDATGVYLLRRSPLSTSDGITYLSIAYDSGSPVYELRQLSEYAAKFNRTHDDVRVRFKPYSDTGLSAAELLAKDISAGKVPDIILFSDTMPYSTFSGFGMFIDLYEMMDGGALTRDSLVSAVREPFEEDGKLFALSLGFNLKLLVPTGAGNVSDNSADALVSMINAHDGPLTALNTDKADTPEAELKLAFLGDILPGLLGEYISGDECDFTDIAGVLKAVNNAKIITTKRLHVTDLQSGKILFDSVTTDRFADFIEEKYTIMGGGKVTSVYPDSGAITVPRMTLAIPKKGKSPDSAFDFIEFCVSCQTEKLGNIDNQRDMQFLSGFPCTEAGLDALFGSLDRFYVQLSVSTKTDPLTGSEYESASSNYMHRETYDRFTAEFPDDFSDPDYIVPTLLTVSDNDIEEFRNLVSEAKVSSVCDGAISSIILEEASAYFSGARTAEDAAKFMTDRVHTRLQETK